jgi:hypothetical protein
LLVLERLFALRLILLAVLEDDVYPPKDFVLRTIA